MGDISYAPLIKEMTWSYSRIKTFEDCPYRWFLRYIRYPGITGDDLFFSGYGKFAHDLIADFYRGNTTALQTQMLYLDNFTKKVQGRPPNSKVFQNYYTDGLNYFFSIDRPPHGIEGVEQKVDFMIGQYPFVGYIDYIQKSDHLGIGDHKSRKLKQRSGKPHPSKSDLDLDSYLRQLYLYSSPVRDQYGSFPDKLSFNCFRDQTMITEQFKKDGFDEACEWAIKQIERITIETEFDPSPEYFKCRYLCEMHYLCCHFPA